MRLEWWKEKERHSRREREREINNKKEMQAKRELETKKTISHLEGLSCSAFSNHKSWFLTNMHLKTTVVHLSLSLSLPFSSYIFLFFSLSFQLKNSTLSLNVIFRPSSSAASSSDYRLAKTLIPPSRWQSWLGVHDVSCVESCMMPLLDDNVRQEGRPRQVIQSPQRVL